MQVNMCRDAAAGFLLVGAMLNLSAKVDYTTVAGRKMASKSVYK